jgi:hypothetical protein
MYTQIVPVHLTAALDVHEAISELLIQRGASDTRRTGWATWMKIAGVNVWATDTKRG